MTRPKLSKRARTLEAMRAAGSQNDQAAWLRLYTGNRISYGVALAAFQAGKAWVARFQTRDEAAKAKAEAGQ